MEVDHRARNVLAIVNSIVRLSRSNNAALYAAAVQQRVQALARAHNLLAMRGWQEVSPGRDHPPASCPIWCSADRAARPGGRNFHLWWSNRLPSSFTNWLSTRPLTAPSRAMAGRSVSNGKLLPQHGGFRLQWSESGGPAPVPARQPRLRHRDGQRDGGKAVMTGPNPAGLENRRARHNHHRAPSRSQHVLHAEA